MVTVDEMNIMMKEIVLGIPIEDSKIKFNDEKRKVYEELKKEIKDMPKDAILDIPGELP